jgi:ADP-ribose pyrophosphatase YjhB (NUDIX family)
MAGSCLQVLTILRQGPPFAQAVALPGVYVQRGETIDQATKRALWQKARFRLPAPSLRQVLGVRDSVARDPRGHALSIYTIALLPTRKWDDGVWADACGLRGLAFDHDVIVAEALAWVRDHAWRDRRIAQALVGNLPLSTSSLITIAAALRPRGVRDRPLDVANQKRIITSGGHLVPTDTVAPARGRGRPGVLWRWT